MKEFRYQVELSEKLPEWIPLNRVKEIIARSEWYGHSYGEAVGRVYADGKVESFFKHDGEGSEWFDTLRSTGVLKKRNRWLINRKTGKKYSCEEYYLMRKVVGHKSELPAVLDDCLDNCMNVKFAYTYEVVLVGDEDYRRYIYRTINTSGPCTYSLLDELENMGDIMEGWAEKDENGFSYEDGEITCKMYNDFGEEVKFPFSSTHEILMCINSVRLVDFKRTIID